jgi:DNA-directed RNA polymerase subunit RPC12/RpoP
MAEKHDLEYFEIYCKNCKEDTIHEFVYVSKTKSKNWFYYTICLKCKLESKLQLLTKNKRKLLISGREQSELEFLCKKCGEITDHKLILGWDDKKKIRYTVCKNCGFESDFNL